MADSPQQIRDLRGRIAEVVRATDAKNEMGKLLEIAASGGAVAITRYGRVRAVLLSADQYGAMAKNEDSDLDRLTREFNQRVVRMNTPKARRAAEALLESTPQELGGAAVSAAGRGRGTRAVAGRNSARSVAAG